MKVSPTLSGHTIADLSGVSPSNPAASSATRGSAFTTVRLLRATQPARPSPTAIVLFRSSLVPTPAVYRHLSVASSPWVRYSAQPDQGTIFVSFDEMRAIVSATPRLVPIDCAIS